MFESISIWYESTNNKETNLYIKIKLKFSNIRIKIYILEIKN